MWIVGFCMAEKGRLFDLSKGTRGSDSEGNDSSDDEESSGASGGRGGESVGHWRLDTHLCMYGELNRSLFYRGTSVGRAEVCSVCVCFFFFVCEVWFVLKGAETHCTTKTDKKGTDGNCTKYNDDRRFDSYGGSIATIA